jgi:TonB-linked SusC/RagA family outer membrane protein
MRKIASLLTVSMFFCSLAFGQPRQVTGTVRDANGAPVPFATVTEAGTRNAVTADANGNFTIRVPENARLTISSTGFTATTVNITNAANVSLTRNTASGQLDEVVVTALGLRRKPQEIGYATATVRPDQITASRSTNLGQALSGKVSGLQVQNNSSGVTGSPRIVLRGLRSLTGNNEALIVLDGVQVPSATLGYINPNDVERVDVLKGGQASTLYGSEGVNGAIVITTKRGGGSKPEITLMYTGNVEEVAYLPKAQYEFGSGSAYGANQTENFHSSENQQYGDRFDGSIRALGRALANGSQLLVPYSANPNARMGFWDKGYTSQTDVSYRAGDANGNLFMSFQNLSTKGIVPGDTYNRNSLRLGAGKTSGKWTTGFDAVYAWDKSNTTNADYYYLSLNTSTWAPLDVIKDWRNNQFGEMSGYFNDYYNNPFWIRDNSRDIRRSQNLNASARLQYKLSSAIDLNARLTLNTITSNTATQNNSYTFTNFSAKQAYSNNFNNNYDRFLTGVGRFISRTNLVGGIGELNSNTTRITGEAYAGYNKNFGNISLKTVVGTQLIALRVKQTQSTTTGIGVPGTFTPAAFNLSNSATGLFTGANPETETRKWGAYVDATVGYKNFVFVHGAFRNDATSLFYNTSSDAGNFSNPNFQTYGGDISFIPTEAFPSIKNRVLESLKLRAGINRNGNDNVSPYGLQLTYGNQTGFPYSGLIGTSVGNTRVNQSLRPENIVSKEAGVELSLFKNRILLEASFYHQNNRDQIISINTSSASGFPAYRLNAADVVNKGMEYDLKVQVWKNRDWAITAQGNYSHNTNEVTNIYAGLDLKKVTYQSAGNYLLSATKGLMFPTLETTSFLRDEQGHVIVDTADGWALRNGQLTPQGTTQPVHILGLGLNVSWKNFTLIANAEYRSGNVVYHSIGQDMTFTGSGAQTNIYHRETFVWPNSVRYDASGKLVPNTNYAVGSYQAIYQGFGDQGYSRGFAGIGEMFVSSAAFWKIRDMNLSYDLPKSLTNRLKVVRGITLSAFARNLVTWLPKDNWYTDPELSNSNGNGQGINNSFNTPPVRQYGGSVKFVF